VREETDELYRFLQWVHGNAEQNPWDSYVYPNWRKTALQKRYDQTVEIAEQSFREAFPDEQLE
jgi:hypothetical protein